MAEARSRSTMPSVDLLEAAAGLLEKTKAEDIVALDLRACSNVCDYFLIASGSSEQHVRALGAAVERGLRDRGVRAWHREGVEGRRWILLDYVDVVVHLFHRESREFYRLERLWADAPVVSLQTSTTQADEEAE